jgi:glycosyltransferase involved in cell wall biosynthesis
LGGQSWSFTVHGPEEFDRAAAIGLAKKIRRADFIVAVSSYGRSQLYRFAATADWPKIHVVHCGLDQSYFAVAAPPFPKEPRFVCVGRLCEQKGQLILVEAAHRLAANGTIFELVFAGDGELRDEIEASIARYKLRDRIRITGWIDGERVQQEIIAARALVLPSFAEGLPIALMEAMALRRPVISTFVAGIPELVMPGKHGWLVPAGDVEGLTRAMRACLDEPTERLARMGEAAHQQAFDRHDISKETAKLAALFKDCIMTNRSPPGPMADNHV